MRARHHCSLRYWQCPGCLVRGFIDPGCVLYFNHSVLRIYSKGKFKNDVCKQQKCVCFNAGEDRDFHWKLTSKGTLLFIIVPRKFSDHYLLVVFSSRSWSTAVAQRKKISLNEKKIPMVLGKTQIFCRLAGDVSHLCKRRAELFSFPNSILPVSALFFFSFSSFTNVLKPEWYAGMKECSK